MEVEAGAVAVVGEIASEVCEGEAVAVDRIESVSEVPLVSFGVSKAGIASSVTTGGVVGLSSTTPGEVRDGASSYISKLSEELSITKGDGWIGF